jgi:hypothetical protein
MRQIPKNLEQLLSSPEAANLMNNKDALQSLSNSPEAQKLIQILSQKNGGNLQAATNAAMQGDPSQLGKILSEATQNPEIAQAIQNLSKNFPR